MCKHPNSDYIEKYYKDHNIIKALGFICWGTDPYNWNMPKIKTSPKWCPRKENDNGK